MRALIVLTGNVGREPELRYTPNGDAVASFSLAVSYGKQVNGQWINETEWFNVSCWGNMAERAAQQLQKGNQVLVEGTIRSRAYEAKARDQSGQEILDQGGNPIMEKRFSMEVRANYFRNHGKRAQDENSGQGGGQSGGGYNQQPQNQGGYTAPQQPQNAQPAQQEQTGGDDYENLPW